MVKLRLEDIMTPNPVLLHPEMPVSEAAKVFVEHGIDGAPVVDERRRVIGLLTKSHILRLVSQEQDMSIPVSEVMTRRVLVGHPRDELSQYFRTTVKRIPVVREDEIVGIVTNSDFLEAFFDSYYRMSTELKAVINATHNVIIAVNEKGIIKLINQAAEKALQVTAEEALGRHVAEIIPNTGLLEVLKEGKTQTAQKIWLNGRCFISNRRPIWKGETLIGAVAVLQDVSELEAVSQELQFVKDLNEVLNAIIESSFDGLFITDRNGYILRANQALERITGFEPGTLVGQNIEVLVKKGIVAQEAASLGISTDQPCTSMQTTPEGKAILWTGSPVFDEDGRVTRIVYNVRDMTELTRLEQKLEQARSLSQHYESQLKTLKLQYVGSDRLVVGSAAMRKLIEMVVRVGQVDSTVLITGESGTGKELIAETIHNNSRRREGPFIKVNCGAIPEHLLESELFGYEAGAFTGARREGKAGYFEMADGGTLFLDEIGELPLNLQVKLLRVLQSKEVTRVGSTRPTRVDARILAGTNRNLEEMVQNKQFREDLYYRLNVIPLYVPPLRERKEEIPLLVVHFVKLINQKYEMNKRFSPEAIEVLMKYDWPGNVRELENLVERLLVTCSGDIVKVEDLPPQFGGGTTGAAEVRVSGILPLKDAVESVERQILEKAYAEYRTTRQIASKLRVDASTIVRKAAKYGLINKLN